MRGLNGGEIGLLLTAAYYPNRPLAFISKGTSGGQSKQDIQIWELYVESIATTASAIFHIVDRNNIHRAVACTTFQMMRPNSDG